MQSVGSNLLLRGGTLVTMNPNREIGQGDIYIENGRIRGIGNNPSIGRKVDDIVDCSGCLIVPGFVQPHIHLCQTLFRGGADDLELLDWLKMRIWPFEAAHDYDSLFASAMLGAAELLLSGTTAILDMGTVHHTDAIFEAASRLGLRATIGKAMMDFGEDIPPGLQETTQYSIDESLALAARWHGKDNDRLRYAFAPRFVLSCSEALLKSVVKEARSRGLGIHTHASENKNELQAVHDVCGMDNLAYFESIDMVGEDTVFAHCVHVSDEGMNMLASTGTHVAHCPSSNLKLASGIALIPEMLERGINVGLASDGAPCSNTLDSFVQMRLAGLIQKPRLGPTAMPAERIVELATINGAKALGLADEIGSLVEGKKADIAVIDATTFHLAPTENPYSMLAYSCRATDVRHVLTDGAFRVRDNRLVGTDITKITRAARYQSGLLHQRLAKRAN